MTETDKEPDEKPTVVITEQDMADFVGVPRFAPQWAWDIIDATLENDRRSKAFDAETRAMVCRAFEAMMDGLGA